MCIVLVSTNRIKPPIGPVGLEYVAEALHREGHTPEILDLCWEEDVESAIQRFFSRGDYSLVGLTIRNTDDCVYGSKQSFLEEHAEIVTFIHRVSDALLVLGGVGFSVMPEFVLDKVRADTGIWGDGEFTFPRLAACLDRNEDWRGLPNLLHKEGKQWIQNRIYTSSLKDLPHMHRGWFDNRRYYDEGGQAGFESKRGCPGNCIYCADPVAKGRDVRLRPPSAVVCELRSLVQKGIFHLHTCDSEFNIVEEHAVSVCEEIIRENLSERMQWYAYCSPVPFSPRLARLMHRAGCVGINFGTDSGDEQMLKRLGRNHTTHDISQTVRYCREEGITVMIDLLLGSPGESEESIRCTIELMKRIQPDCVGISAGVRVYPGTGIFAMIAERGLKDGIVGDPGHGQPVFFIEPQVTKDLFELLERFIDEDRRFFFLNPFKSKASYNYNANQKLIDAIRSGSRGAYWDILRKSY